MDPYRSGWTLIDFLTHRFKYLPPSRWVERIAESRVRVNGSAVAADHAVVAGDVISYTIVHNEPPVDFDYRIIYEDEHLLAVNKPGNLPVHASGIFIRNTLIARLKREHGEHVNLAHRLDRETSGLVLLTKSAAAARAVSRLFSRGEVRKSYVAVVHGRVPDDAFVVDAPIAKAPVLAAIAPHQETMRDIDSDLKADLPKFVPYRRVDFEGGKPALTRLSVLRRAAGFTTLAAEPVSGRTNQIRVHLAYAGFPIVGDKIYGDAALDAQFPALRRQALHCRRLALAHPMTRAPLTLEAELPADLAPFV